MDTNLESAKTVTRKWGKSLQKSCPGSPDAEGRARKLDAMQMIDVELPTTDNRVVVLSRYTEPEKDLLLLLRQLQIQLPAQPPPKIKARNNREVA